MKIILFIITAILTLAINGCAETEKEFIKQIKNCSGEKCANLGNDYFNGKRYKQNYAYAIKLFTKACDDKNAIGCLRLGDMYKNGNLLEQNYAKAISLYTKACYIKSKRIPGYGCQKIADMYKEGDGVKQDRAKAENYFIEACNYGSIDICRGLATDYDFGINSRQQNKTKNIIKAKKFYKKACDGGNPIGCKRYKELKKGNWHTNIQKSLINNSKQVTLSLPSSDGEKATLFIRCKVRIEVFVVWDIFIGINNRYVKSRLDNEEILSEEWTASKDGKAVFKHRNVISFTEELVKHDKLVLELEPYNRSSIQTLFYIQGLSEVINSATEACR